MSFEVFTRSLLTVLKDPTVTVYQRGLIALNGAAFAALGAPVAVALLFDRESRTIGIRPVAPTFPDSRFVRRGSSGPNGPYLISALTFLRHYEVRFSGSLRWPAVLSDGLLTLDVSQPGVPVTSNRATPQRGERS